ncbi:MAG: hypothetical protein GXY42_04215 [Desulfovibrionales bacterium]|nr:hypothetical protein [Desulfovibrionales bacterium]
MPGISVHFPGLLICQAVLALRRENPCMDDGAVHLAWRVGPVVSMVRVVLGAMMVVVTRSETRQAV